MRYHRFNRRRHRQALRRRGIVLLIVLSLLVLFAILGVGYTIFAGQYRRSAIAFARVQQQETPPQKTLDMAFYQFIRDTPDAYSVARFHSLLYDMYGLDAIKEQVVSTSLIGNTGNQFTDITVNSTTLSQTAGYYNGCVLTFLSGNLKGLSTRVVGYTIVPPPMPPVGPPPPSQQRTFRIVTPVADGNSLLAPAVNDVFLVNGRPFNGTGFGYNPGSGFLNVFGPDSLGPDGQPGVANVDDDGDTTVDNMSEHLWPGSDDISYGLLPNFAAQTAVDANQGGANEPYDAVDFQNMILAGILPPTTSGGSPRILPSFHRPALINYWFNHPSSKANPSTYAGGSLNANYRDFVRQFFFRPMPWDHPEFTGGNLTFTYGADGGWGVAGTDDDGANGIDDIGEAGWPGSDDLVAWTTGPWDVDNDNDGVTDSIWLDLGFPVFTTRDGRTAKPLIAPLVVDMDGRFNLNAHGSFAQLAGQAGVTVPQSQPTSRTFLAAGAQTSDAPPGSGYGPSEIDLSAIFGTSVNRYTNTAALMVGNSSMTGRYGTNARPGTNGSDNWTSVRFFDYPANFFATAALTSFSSPPDLRGELGLGLDYRGQPVFSAPAPNGVNTLADHPYEIDLSSRGSRGAAGSSAADHPFTAAELERILRRHDIDAPNLPDRLRQLVPGLVNDVHRRVITTDSYDLPTPGISTNANLRVTMANMGLSTRRPHNIVEIVRLRMLNRLGIASPNYSVEAWINQQLARMVSPDLVNGSRMNINRPFGNGQDDNGDFIVDDMSEAGMPSETIWSAGVQFDHDNDGNVGSDSDAYLARQIYARHLYVLAMALIDSGVTLDLDADGNNDNTAQTVAQWAINAVDFRDADSIMTPFEYDPDPFDGWLPDGNIGTDETSDGVDNDGDGQIDGMDSKEAMDDRAVVWGCERPELLITETFATYDRRTQDLASPGGTTTDTPPDMHFDQRLRPRGTFFVELLNPWANEDRLPAEFYYDYPNNAWSSGLLLDQIAPGGTPVWRLVVMPDSTTDPEASPSSIERSVYFGSVIGPRHSGSELQFSTTIAPAPLLPGRYAVIGPTGQTIDATGAQLDLNNNMIRDYVSPLGRKTGALENTMTAGGLDYKNTRRIVLEPNANPNVPPDGQVKVENNVLPPMASNPYEAGFINLGPPAPMPPTRNILPPIAIVINQGTFPPSGGMPGTYTTASRQLTLTEPVGGYPAVDTATIPFDPAAADNEGAYTTPFDVPFDDGTPLATNGTISAYKVVVLQRLANPRLPYDATFNPYKNIDSTAVPLTRFNGVESTPGAPDPLLYTAERGKSSNLLWRHEGNGLRTSPASTSSSSPNQHVFNYNLGHSLGYMSTYFGSKHSDVTMASYPAYIGAPNVNALSNAGTPFSWLTWNNRPFVSQYELMQVPITSQDNMLRRFRINGTGVGTREPYAEPFSRFSHLLNFYHTHISTGVALNTQRILEFTHVPSRFVGTEDWFNPSQFQTSAGAAGYRPPFNNLPTYREPGKINLNTLFDGRVYTGLLNGHSGPSFDQFTASRRGYGSASSPVDPLQFNNSMPTFFANPFRPPGCGDMVPLRGMVRPDTECTILRSERIGPSAAQPSAASGQNPMFEVSASEQWRRTDLNPYFRYLTDQRLGNLVTNRSNVYAIWLTVGYFEVSRTTGQLGQEVGADTGEIKRHRAFYIFDRSIPMAFEAGENHNVDRGILVRRFIE